MACSKPDGGWGDLQLISTVKFLKRNGFSAAKAAKPFGRELGVPQSKIDTIYKDEDGSEERLVAIIQYFLDNGEKSWEKLAEALKNCEYSNLSKFILQNISVEKFEDDGCLLPTSMNSFAVNYFGAFPIEVKPTRRSAPENFWDALNSFADSYFCALMPTRNSAARNCLDACKLVKECKHLKETQSPKFLNLLTTANKVTRKAMNLIIQLEDDTYISKNLALNTLKDMTDWISMQEKIHLAHIAEDTTRKRVPCWRNGTRRDSSFLFHRESKLEVSSFHFSATFLNELTTANKFARKAMNFILHHEGDAGVQKVVLDSFSDLSDWTSKEVKILLARMDDYIARNRVQRRSGKAASSLLGASELGGKLTPQQMNSLREYINKLIPALQHFQCWAS